MELQCSSRTYLHLTRLCVLKRNVCCDVASFVVCAETRDRCSCQATVPQSVGSSGLAPARALCCGSTDVHQMFWQAAPGATRHEYERSAVGNASFYGTPCCHEASSRVTRIQGFKLSESLATTVPLGVIWTERKSEARVESTDSRKPAPSTASAGLADHLLLPIVISVRPFLFGMRMTSDARGLAAGQLTVRARCIEQSLANTTSARPQRPRKA